MRAVGGLQALVVFAGRYTYERRVTPEAIQQQLPIEPPRTPSEMKAAEELFRIYDLFLWLAGRMGHGVFRGQQHVQKHRQQVATMIDVALRRLGGVESAGTWSQQAENEPAVRCSSSDDEDLLNSVG
jgi:hypothetical protein